MLLLPLSSLRLRFSLSFVILLVVFFLLIVGVLAQVRHVIFYVSQDYVNLQRHELLHENEIREV